jgi:hypothetical protein
MGRLDSFKPKKLVIGSPYITITNNGVSLNKSAVARLDYAEYVRILLDEDAKELAIQICDDNDPNKESFVKPEKKDETQYVRWNNKEFVKQLLTWGPENLREAGFKVPGEYLSDEKALLFIFSEAVNL